MATTAAATGDRSSHRSPSRSRWWVIASFLAPGLLILGALVVYPIIYTLVRSMFDAGGGTFVGFDNYVRMFQRPTTFTAIKNNILWVVIAPVACTALGLVFAVLLERIRWKTAFRLIIFMPMAISMLAAGVIFRGLFQENPDTGAVNAAIVAVENAVGDSAHYPGAAPRPDVGLEQDGSVISLSDPVTTGSTHGFPLVRIKQDDLPETAAQAAQAPEASDSQITGTVWLDLVRGGGGTNGEINEGKSGLPGVRVDAVAEDGSIAAHTTTGDDGTFVLDGLDSGQEYRLALPGSNFAEGADGVSWLSKSLINVVVILSYIWIWAGFAMVMIASGLSAMDRSLQEAARMDGANEWQVFTRITAPLLAPVLVVVLVTLIINVLKIFDLVYVIPPGNARPAANVIAVEMWTVSFGGGNDHGLGSALAILLLILVLPSMIINVRRFREERRS